MLIAHHLTRIFGQRVAVADMSLELHCGEVFALLGPNGAGKTTTLRLLAGLIAPTSGSVTIDGEPLTPRTGSKLRRQIGFLTEHPGLWDRLTVRQHLRVYAGLYGLPDEDTAIDRVVTKLDMHTLRDRRAGELSKGMRQRVALARALLHDPRFVLLDEPTSGLDPSSARAVRSLIQSLRDEGRAVLVSTHNLDEAERVATRVAVLRTLLLAADTPAALRGRLFTNRLTVTLSTDAQCFGALLERSGVEDVNVSGSSLSLNLGTTYSTPEIVNQLVEGGAQIESVVQDSASLEQVYHRLLDGDSS